MADGPVIVQCPDCGVGNEVADLGLSRLGCSNCGWAYFLRRCSGCRQVGFVSALQGWHQPWECLWCAAFNSRFSHYNDPATATVAELAADIERRRLSPAPPPAEVPAPTPPAPESPALESPALESPAPESPADSITQPIPVGIWVAHDQVPQAPPRPWHRVRRVLEPVLLTAALVAAATLVIIAGRPGPAGSEHATAMIGVSLPRTHGPTTRAVSVAAGRADAVDFRGVPGQLTVVAADTGQVTLTGQLHWTGRAPIAVTRLNPRSHVLLLSYRCASASPCGENYRLTVPRSTAVALRQPSGQITLSGLAGPLRIIASGVHVSATGLRSPSLLAQITSGDLAASFATAPSRVAVTLVSAQATLALPGPAAYRLNQQVAHGYVQANIAQDPASPRSVTVHIESGELTLLPELPEFPASTGNPIRDGTRNHHGWRAQRYPVPAGQQGRGRSKEAHVG